MGTCGHPSFLTDVRLSRLVASDYLVTIATNRYSVPLQLIGQAVDVERRGRWSAFITAASSPASTADCPDAINCRSIRNMDPAGAAARNARRKLSNVPTGHPADHFSEVEIRDLAIYEQLAGDTAAAAQEATP